MGVGTGEKIVEKFCREHAISICGFCDKKAGVIKEHLGYPVHFLTDMVPNEDYFFMSININF